MKFLRKAFGSRVSGKELDASSSVAFVPEDEESAMEVLVQASEISSDKDTFPFAVGAISDQGGYRSQNEDTLFHLQSVLSSAADTSSFGIFIVADGLGGHEDGQIASELTIRTVSSHLIKTVYAPLVAEQGQDSETVPLNESLTKSVEIANRVVCKGTHGGGSTLTAVLLLDRTAYIIHVGDSRTYLICGDSVSQLTQDHSLGGRLMEVQGLSDEEVAHLPERHTLYKALGQPTSPEPDIHYRSIAPGSHLLLCSDGLWGFVSQQDILEAFQTFGDPQAICTRLANMAIARGSDDNVSLIALVSKGS